ncbi:kinase-like domain-containing protein [Ochromonadaceae sp. CCMP2298]|nr:kinase-like domain-containing protein [Ochromonadaceae sp. CCMP2298]
MARLTLDEFVKILSDDLLKGVFIIDLHSEVKLECLHVHMCHTDGVLVGYGKGNPVEAEILIVTDFLKTSGLLFPGVFHCLSAARIAQTHAHFEQTHPGLFCWAASEATSLYELAECTWKALISRERKLSECLMWALRTPTSLPPAGCAAGSPEYVEFFQADLETIAVDFLGIQHLCSFFKQVVPTLAFNFSPQFVASCLDPYRQGKVYNFSWGWRQRTPAMDEEVVNWDSAEMERAKEERAAKILSGRRARMAHASTCIITEMYQESGRQMGTRNAGMAKPIMAQAWAGKREALAEELATRGDAWCQFCGIHCSLEILTTRRETHRCRAGGCAILKKNGYVAPAATTATTAASSSSSSSLKGKGTGQDSVDLMDTSQVDADRGPLYHVLRDAIMGPVDVDFQYLSERTLGFAEEERVGGGAFRDVFRGVEPRSGDYFAVKRISPLLLGPAALPHAVAAAQHSYNCEIQALSKFREKALVYEFLPGGSLADTLRDDQRAAQLTWKARVHVRRQVAIALNFLHRGGAGAKCFHRDVKSANICLTATLSAKLIDCGLAMFIAEDDERTGRMRVFSFGIVVVEVLTGRLQMVDGIDLCNQYINGDDELSPAVFDSRAGQAPQELALSLCALARECLRIHCGGRAA